MLNDKLNIAELGVDVSLYFINSMFENIDYFAQK